MLLFQYYLLTVNKYIYIRLCVCVCVCRIYKQCFFKNIYIASHKYLVERYVYNPWYFLAVCSSLCACVCTCSSLCVCVCMCVGVCVSVSVRMHACVCVSGALYANMSPWATHCVAYKKVDKPLQKNVKFLSRLSRFFPF